MKLSQGRCRLDIRKSFSAGEWLSIGMDPREVVAAAACLSSRSIQTIFSGGWCGSWGVLHVARSWTP